jgi:hypothetical protein
LKNNHEKLKKVYCILGCALENIKNAIQCLESHQTDIRAI